MPEGIWTPVISSLRAHEWPCPCHLLVLQEEHLRFSNNLTLFFLCLKGKIQLFQVGLR